MQGQETTFILFKPDVFHQGIASNIYLLFEENQMEVVAEKISIPNKKMAEEHLNYRYNSFEDTAKNLLKRCSKENIPLKGTFLANKTEIEIGHDLKKLIVEYLISGPVWGWVLKGENIILRMRELCGSTFPDDADKKSIRGKYGKDNFRDCILQSRVPQNIIHSAECKEEADHQMKIWVPTYNP